MMPNPTGGEDWHSQDDPPPKTPEPKPDPKKAVAEWDDMPSPLHNAF